MSAGARRAAMLAALMSLMACAPMVQRAGLRGAPPHLAADVFVAGDGAALPYRAWLPDNPGHGAPPKAVIVALHGFNDYSMAFAGAAEYWRRRGIATYAYDQRGFGETAEPGIWPGTETMTGDLADFTRAVRRRHPGAPVYLLGLSMGGAVALKALAEDGFPKVDGAILSAPAVWGRETMPFFYDLTLWLAAHTVPWLHLDGSGLKRVASDNEEMLIALGRDPLVIKGSRTDTLYGLVNLMDEALEAAPGVDVPLLVLYGRNDQIIPPEPVRLLAERLGVGARDGRRLAHYEKGYHMLLRDLQAETVHADIAAWIFDRAAALPSAADADALERLAAKP